MQNSNEDKMPDPLDFVPGQKVEPTPDDINGSHSAPTPRVTPKKRGVMSDVFMAILLVPVIIFAVFSWMMASHDKELSKLKQETMSVVGGPNPPESAYECHDVELNNTCFFMLSGSDGTIESLLLSQGFSKNEDYGNGYRRGNLYIINSDAGNDRSFYLKLK